MLADISFDAGKAPMWICSVYEGEEVVQIPTACVSIKWSYENMDNVVKCSSLKTTAMQDPVIVTQCCYTM